MKFFVYVSITRFITIHKYTKFPKIFQKFIFRIWDFFRDGGRFFQKFFYKFFYTNTLFRGLYPLFDRQNVIYGGGIRGGEGYPPPMGVYRGDYLPFYNKKDHRGPPCLRRSLMMSCQNNHIYK